LTSCKPVSFQEGFYSMEQVSNSRAALAMNVDLYLVGVLVESQVANRRL
jgi:hypothetical protein